MLFGIFSIILNTILFFSFPHFTANMTTDTIGQLLALNVLLIFIINVFFLFFVYSNPIFFNCYQEKLFKPYHIINKLIHLIYSVLFTFSLAVVIYHPSLFSIFGLFIIVFVVHYFIVMLVIYTFIFLLVERGFRYHLQNNDVVTQFLQYLSPITHVNFSNSTESDEKNNYENNNLPVKFGYKNYHLVNLYEKNSLTTGSNRLSIVEIYAIDEIFKRKMRKELKTNLRTILTITLSVWIRLISSINAVILSLLIFFIIKLV